MQKILLLIVAILTLALINYVLFSPTTSQQTSLWDITQPTLDSIQVFGITLNKTTLQQAQKILNKPAKIALIKDIELSSYSIEAYFGEVTPGHLSGHCIVTLVISKEQMLDFEQRSIEKKVRHNGSLFFTLSPTDNQIAQTSKIKTITFIPYVTFTPALIDKYFGQPSIQLTENTTTQHYLYPKKGLDITLYTEQPPVFQYISPPYFKETILVPLQHKIKTANSAKN